MKKPEFMELLRRELAVLPQGELDKHVNYYEELLNDMMDDGMSEEEALARLGDPVQLAKQILANIPNPPKPIMPPQKANVKKVSAWMAVAIVVGAPVWIVLLAAFLAVLAAVVVAVFAVVLAAVGLVAGLLFGGIALIFAAFLTVGSTAASSAMMVGGGLLCIGCSILATFAVIALVKGIRWAAGKIRTEVTERKNKKL